MNQQTKRCAYLQEHHQHGPKERKSNEYSKVCTVNKQTVRIFPPLQTAHTLHTQNIWCCKQRRDKLLYVPSKTTFERPIGIPNSTKNMCFHQIKLILRIFTPRAFFTHTVFDFDHNTETMCCTYLKKERLNVPEPPKTPPRNFFFTENEPILRILPPIPPFSFHSVNILPWRRQPFVLKSSQFCNQSSYVLNQPPNSSISLVQQSN